MTVRMLIDKMRLSESASNLIKKDQRLAIVEDRATKYVVEVDESNVALLQKTYGALREMSE